MRPDDIAYYAQLASILEASAPKPGNVSPGHDFSDTKYTDFVIAGIAIGDACEKAAQKGSEAEIGKLIKEAVIESSKWHTGRNTNLGIAMLLIPLCAAAGMSLSKGNDFRDNIMPIIKGTTHHDTLELYSAIRRSNLGGLGSAKRLDVTNRNSDREIKKDDINMFSVMKVTKDNSIARELTTSYDISFNVGYKAIVDSYDNNLKDAIVHSHLTILSKYPDSLIARKNTMEIAEKVSKDAKAVLEGNLDITDFDAGLRSEDNRLNPGTTADIVASSIFIALLKGDLL